MNYHIEFDIFSNSKPFSDLNFCHVILKKTLPKIEILNVYYYNSEQKCFEFLL